MQHARMNRALQNRLERMRASVKLFASSKAFRLLEHKLSSERQSLDVLRENALRAMRERMTRARAELSRKVALLSALDPSAVLVRGYAIITDAAGQTLVGVSAMEKGVRVNIRMQDGTAGAEIEEIIHGGD